MVDEAPPLGVLLGVVEAARGADFVLRFGTLSPVLLVLAFLFWLLLLLPPRLLLLPFFWRPRLSSPSSTPST